MIDLKTKLYDLISAITPLYEEEKPENVNLPYAVYTFNASSDVYAREDIPLVIDLWSNNMDNTAIDTLSQTLKKELDEYTFADADVGFTLYFISRTNVPDPEKTIRHRQLLFTCTTYFK